MERGERAPDFTLDDYRGERVSPGDFPGKWMVLYFYPKDNTSGCTKEAQDFSLLKEKFEKEGCVVIGVSPDSSESHKRFIEKHGLTVMLLSDTSKETLSAYGAWGTKKNYGREYMGVIRTTVLINPSGVVEDVWKKVRVRKKLKSGEVLHAQTVLDRLKELKTDA